MKIQCDTCLIKARCKHKSFGTLIKECQYLNEILYYADGEGIRMPWVSNRTTEFDKIINKVFKSLNPTKWDVGKFKGGYRKAVTKIIWLK